MKAQLKMGLAKVTGTPPAGEGMGEGMGMMDESPVGQGVGDWGRAGGQW